MDILSIPKNNDFSQPQIEQVEKKKHEYVFLGSYTLRKGMKLFYYNHLTDIIKEIKIEYSNTMNIIVEDGEMRMIDLTHEKCKVDSRFTQFQCLNLKSAKKRVEKYKAGKIKELFNLTKPNKTVISFF